MAGSVFGALHFVSEDVQGSNVVAVHIDQQNTENVIITSKHDIRIYECEGRIVHQTWLCKSWQRPFAGCLNTRDGVFYCPISDNKLIKFTSSETHLDDIKPIKVSSSIHSLAAYKGNVFVVYTNGFVERVADACRDRHTPRLLPVAELIADVLIVDDMVTLSTYEKNSNCLVPSRVHYFSLQCSRLCDVSVYKVARSGLALRGLGLIKHCWQQMTHSAVYTVWSNGDLCCAAVGPYLRSINQGDVHLQLFTEGNFGSALCCAKVVKVVQPTHRHLALLGRHVSTDGGRIVLWDFDVCMEAGRGQFKLYHQRIKCWQHHSGHGGVLMVEKDDLTVVPLATMPARGRAQILDKAIPSVVFQDGDIVHHDGKTCKNVVPDDRTKLKQLLKQFDLTSRTDDYSCQVLITWLSSLPSSPWGLVLEIIDYYSSTMSEQCVLDLLQMVMQGEDVKLPLGCSSDAEQCNASINVQVGIRKNVFNKSNGISKEPHQTESQSLNPIVPQHGSPVVPLTDDKVILVERLLDVPIMQAALLDQLRSRPLFYRHALQIMQHLQHTLDNVTYSDMKTSIPRQNATWLVALHQGYFHTILLDQIEYSNNITEILNTAREDLENDVVDMHMYMEMANLLLKDDVNLWPSRELVEDDMYTINKYQLPMFSLKKLYDN